MKYLLPAASCLLLTATGAIAQPAGSRIQWSREPVLHTIPDSLNKYSAVFVLDEREITMRVEDGNLYQYRTVHNIIRLQDDKGVEGFNTMSLSGGYSGTIQDIHARAVLPGGAVREVPAGAIRTQKAENGQKEFIYAYEGLAIGAEIEYTYTDRRPATYFGLEQTQYKQIPVMESRYRLISPDRFLWEHRSLNGFPPVQDSMLNSTNRIYYATAAGAAPVPEEEYSNAEPARRAVEYKLSYTRKGSELSARLFTWNDLAARLAQDYATFTSRELKDAGKYLQSIGISPNGRSKGDVLRTIRIIEDSLKKGILIDNDIPGSTGFAQIIKDKTTHQDAFIRLFAGCLTAAGIPFQVGYMANRFEYVPDSAFENWSGLDEHLFYFPQQGMYLCPAARSFRMPFIPPGLAGSKGIFVPAIPVRKGAEVKAELRSVPLQPVAASSHDLTVDITFGPAMLPVAEVRQSLRGYSASSLLDYFVLVPPEKTKELVTAVIALTDKPEAVRSYSVENAAYNSYSADKALEVSATVEVPQLLEKAGPKYLFKVGELIGKQQEMYSSERRMLPIDVYFMHSLTRTITVHIPDGYRVANPEALTRNVRYTNAGGKESMAFVSGYKLSGNVLQISIREAYEEQQYPISEYEHFREVINAAADFNKIVLVLEKH